MDVPTVPAFRALILEDHDFQRSICAQVLRNCGAIEILEASDGAAALEHVCSAVPQLDILVCDLKMPGMDGFAFLRHIGKLGCKSSVILASALDASIVRAADIMCKSYGIRILGIMEKPPSRAKLLPLLLRHFSQRLHKPREPMEQMPLDEIVSGVKQRQFLPFFQPKINVRSGAMIGVEALMRWRHPERGWVPPAAFIQLMETNGLIDEVTFDLINSALGHSKKWRDSGLEIPIAINMSVESLRDTRLPDQLESLMLAAGLQPNCMTIEVTETVAMTDIGHSLETLARCRMKGFDLSMDDYGTGFSSMQQLTRLPLSELKIDQTFITGAADEPILQTLIEASITMARGLGLKTVAEGVETSEDWSVITRLGCDCAQGYFIAKPMAGEHLVEWYTNWLGVPSRPRMKIVSTD